MSIIRDLFVAILVFGAGSHLQAQPNIDSEARKEAISQARYLKSIYKTDEAIDLLAPYVSQDSFDEEADTQLRLQAARSSSVLRSRMAMRSDQSALP